MRTVYSSLKFPAEADYAIPGTMAHQKC